MHDPVGKFSDWLHVEMRTRRMSVRQLAHRSGVAASTVSRVLRGHRRPTLSTTLKLIRAIGAERAASAAANLLGPSDGSSSDPAGLVERALRSDEWLRDADVRQAMSVYLDLRARRVRAARRSGIAIDGPR